MGDAQNTSGSGGTPPTSPEPSPNKPSAADLLAHMARRPVTQEDALAAMAEGKPPEEEALAALDEPKLDVEAALDDLQNAPPDAAALEAELAAIPDGASPQQLSEPAAPAVPTFVPPRKGSGAVMASRIKQAHLHQYQTFMIPLLLTVGVILLICATLMTVVNVDQRILYNIGSWFPMVSYPLGLVLLAGAWLFHKQVSARKR